jgi:hypothetical protein
MSERQGVQYFLRVQRHVWGTNLEEALVPYHCWTSVRAALGNAFLGHCNTVVGVIGVSQDITEDRQKANLKQIAAHTAQLEAEKHMVAYFAHKLRNP